MTPIEKYLEFLASKGWRLTREREVVVDEVYSSVAPFDAVQLLARLAGREPRVSRSTMYRTLESLLDAGLIRMLTEPDGRQSYTHI
jgi:Fur family ferric uptake transcriptional regulator